MKKPSLLYASPMSPMKSGISDYSEILVAALLKKFEITLYIDNYEMSNIDLARQCKILKYGCHTVNFAEYDYIIYNMGNNQDYHKYIYEACLKHPGMIILHDFVLYHLFAGYYQARRELYTKIFQEEGIDTFIRIKNIIKESGIELIGKKMADKFPFNSELLKSGNKIMVHSWYSYNKVLKSEMIEKKSVTKINHIPLIEKDPEKLLKDELLNLFHIPKDTFIISSFGFIVPTKMNHVVCEVVKKLSAEIQKKICYVMVGEGNCVDVFVDGKTIIKTGYVELCVFNSFIEYSDLIINLRNPSMGETSGSMLRILQKGKACIINDGGWFSEIPEECVIKVDLEQLNDQLMNKIKYYIEHPQEKHNIETNAREYIDREYDVDDIVNQIEAFLKG